MIYAADSRGCAFCWICQTQVSRVGIQLGARKYEGSLRSSWPRLITPTRNFVEVRWRSLFPSTSLGKRRTSYNAPPTSRIHAADHWSLRNFLPRSSLFMVRKAQKSHGARSELYGGCSNGVPSISVSASIATFQSCNTDAPLRLLRYPKEDSSKTIVTPLSRNRWSVVRRASLVKGGTSKNTVNAPPQSSDSEQ
jgi:hypothetical protein